MYKTKQLNVQYGTDWMFLFTGSARSPGPQGICWTSGNTCSEVIFQWSGVYVVSLFPPTLWSFCQGKAGPDGTVGFPGVRGPQVKQDETSNNNTKANQQSLSLWVHVFVGNCFVLMLLKYANYDINIVNVDSNRETQGQMVHWVLRETLWVELTSFILQTYCQHSIFTRPQYIS